MSEANDAIHMDEAELIKIRDEFFDLSVLCEPADRPEAEAAMDLAYRLTDFEPTKWKMWTSSPTLGCYCAWVLSEKSDELYAFGERGRHWRERCVNTAAWRLRKWVDGFGDEIAPEDAKDRRKTLPSRSIDHYEEYCRPSGVDEFERFADLVLARADALGRSAVADQVVNMASCAGYGQHDARRMSVYWVFRGKVPEVDRLEGLFGLTRHSGWYWMRDDLNIFAERTTDAHLKDGLLHREGGPALAFPDGTAKNFLNGVIVPRWLAELRDGEIDPRWIKDIRNVEIRREFLRKVGMERLAHALNAVVLEDEGGAHGYALMEMDLGDDQRIRMLRMRNPSIDAEHLEAVPPTCNTVQEALNFRNGLTPEMIDDVDGAEWWQQGDVIIRPAGATKFRSRPSLLT